MVDHSCVIDGAEGGVWVVETKVLTINNISAFKLLAGYGCSPKLF